MEAENRETVQSTLVMLQQTLEDLVRCSEPGHCSRASGMNYSKFSLKHGLGHKERTGKFAFLTKGGHCTSVLQVAQVHDYKAVG